MKLVTVAAAGAIWAIAGLGPVAAQDSTPSEPGELGEAPALRGSDDADESGDSAPADAALPEVTLPEVTLAEARSAAQAEAAAPAEEGAISAVSDPLVENVADYALFQRDLAAIEERVIEEPSDLDAIMDTLAGYTANVLTDGWLSYAAFIAAQQPEFVDRVRKVSEYYGEDQLIQGMLNEPTYVLSFEGAREAAGVVLDVMRDDAAELELASSRLKQESYDLQTRGWSNMIARDRPARLEVLQTPKRITTPSGDMKANVSYGAPIAADEPAESAQMRRAAFWSTVDYRPAPAFSTPMTRADENADAIGVMMTLGALRAMGVSSTRPDLVEHLLNLPTAKSCLDFSLLHMRQCVAAAHFKYEDAFCIAEHQLQDASECLGATVFAAGRVTPPTGTVTLGGMTAENPATVDAAATTSN